MKFILILTCTAAILLGIMGAFISAIPSTPESVNWSAYAIHNAIDDPELTKKTNEARTMLSALDQSVSRCRVWSRRIAWGGLLATGLAGIVTAISQKKGDETNPKPRNWGIIAAVLIAFGAATQIISVRLDTTASSDKQRADVLFIAIKKVTVNGLDEQQSQQIQLQLDLEGAMRP